MLQICAQNHDSFLSQHIVSHQLSKNDLLLDIIALETDLVGTSNMFQPLIL